MSPKHELVTPRRLPVWFLPVLLVIAALFVGGVGGFVVGYGYDYVCEVPHAIHRVMP